MRERALQPADGGWINSKGPSDVCQRLALGKPHRLLALMCCQLGWTTEFNATGLGTPTALACSCADKFPLELSQTAEHRDHQLAMWRGAIGPCVLEGTEASPALSQLVEHVEEVASARPPRRRSSRPRSQAPGGILDCSRQLAASRSSPPNGHPAPPSVGCWIFAGRAARSRSNSLVISTTEQHAALPYQGSGHWRPKVEFFVSSGGGLIQYRCGGLARAEHHVPGALA